MSELSELIKTAKNIEKQNTEIIRLLKKIAGEEEEENKAVPNMPPMDFGELYLSTMEEIKEEEAEIEEVENNFQIGTLLENVIDVGEVYFVEGQDIFRLSVKDNKTAVDNLTGDGEPDDFTLQELIANETVKNNVSLDDGSVILSSQQSQNLPETLRICVEQGAKKVYMPLFSSAQLVGAPQFLMDILKFDFYKSEEQLVEKLFN